MRTTLFVLGVLDMIVFRLALDRAILPSAAIGAHGLLTALAFALWWWWTPQRRFAPVMGMVAGPCGVLVGTVAPALLQFVIAISRRSSSTLEHAPLPEATGDGLVKRVLDGRVRHPDPSRLVSLATLLRHGSLEQRCAALETAVRSFDPRLSRLVSIALNDEDQTVRALAAATASQVSHRIAHQRRAFGQALTRRDGKAATLLAEPLAAHVRHNVLLSESQREVIVQEILVLSQDRRFLENVGRETGELLMSEALKTGDLARLDQLCIDLPEKVMSADARQAMQWWRRQPAPC
ncbi:hypothetical protein [Novosphingobium cyanobacteriorum]|uniref:Uncharacterized protein n=1 Tax=Novosphingobium cyanobacteriorum TaxID=3024215 RepID=A0ABT6CNU4_9SPHN|nr:hypothetical protein [Novosphingobium cyanobacteriorum]MDF8335532.1 hypothetical protein [Novosphingobium cyanobacteriorum]